MWKKFEIKTGRMPKTSQKLSPISFLSALNHCNCFHLIHPPISSKRSSVAIHADSKDLLCAGFVE
jgi:hypothetical protein